MVDLTDISGEPISSISLDSTGRGFEVIIVRRVGGQSRSAEISSPSPWLLVEPVGRQPFDSSGVITLTIGANWASFGRNGQAVGSVVISDGENTCSLDVRALRGSQPVSPITVHGAGEVHFGTATMRSGPHGREVDKRVLTHTIDVSAEHGAFAGMLRTKGRCRKWLHYTISVSGNPLNPRNFELIPGEVASIDIRIDTLGLKPGLDYQGGLSLLQLPDRNTVSHVEVHFRLESIRRPLEFAVPSALDLGRTLGRLETNRSLLLHNDGSSRVSVSLSAAPEWLTVDMPQALEVPAGETQRLLVKTRAPLVGKKRGLLRLAVIPGHGADRMIEVPVAGDFV